MTVSFLSPGTTNPFSGQTGTAGFSVNGTVSIPGGGAIGDRVVAVMNFNGTDPQPGALTAPTTGGWVEIYAASFANGSSLSIVERSWITGITAPVWTITDTNSDGSLGRYEAAAAIVRGASGAPSLGTPVNKTATSTSIVVPGVTSTTNGGIVVVAADRVSNQTTFAAAPGSPLVELAKLVTTANGAGSVGIWGEQRPSGGATGTRQIDEGLTTPNGIGIMLNYAEATGGTPPTANAGTDREVASGTAVTMGTGNPSAPGATSVAWSILSSPDPTPPTITNSTNLTTASFTPTVAGDWTIRLTATNSSGSDTDDVVITVTDVTVVPIGTISNPGSWTPVNAASLEETQNDSSDTTYMESDAATEVCTLLLGAVATGSGYTMRIRARSFPAAGDSLSVALLQASTVIANRTIASLADTPTDYAFSLTTDEIADITDRSDLRYRYTNNG